MSFQTVFGLIRSRGSRSRNTITQSVFLKDNKQLEPVFSWLKRNNIKSVRDLNPRLLEAFDEIEFQDEVKWDVDEKFWIIHFHNSKPFKGNFSTAVPKYFSLFKKIIFRPYRKEREKLKLLGKIRKIEIGVEHLKEGLKEGV